MTNNSYQIILSYRIESDPINNNAHSNAVYQSFENIASEMQGKQEETTSTYLFRFDDYQQFKKLLERIEQEYKNITEYEEDFYDDIIRVYLVTPDREFIIHYLKIEEGCNPCWGTMEFCTYFNELK